MVFAIIVEELFGYEVSFLSIGDEDAITQRMSAVGTGTCSPVHVNMEVSASGLRPKHYAVYSNETYTAGSIGYPGREGLYTTVDFVKAGLNITKSSPTFTADFWRGYQSNEGLIGSLSVSRLKSNTEFYPPTEPMCASDNIGCENSCSKTAACTAREAQGKECMVAAMMQDYTDKGYMEAVFDNLEIPAFFCFLGNRKLEKYAVDAQAKSEPVLFYHYEPDPFHEFKGLFRRMLLPLSTPETSQLTTGTFGEHGFGEKSDNPVNVDFPYTSLQKYASTLIQDVPLVNSLVSRMFMSEIEVNELLHKFVQATNNPGNPPVKDPIYSASCSWLRENYAIWSLWLGRLPSCNVYYSIKHEYVGCEPNSTVFPRVIKSSWLYPSPENSSLPHNCDDGDFRSPPKPMVTSRSCEWLLTNRVIWVFWFVARPVCDSTYYKYSVSSCEHLGSKQEVMYRWLILNATNASLSAECRSGISLPAPVFLDCEYVPYEPQTFKVVVILAGVLSVVFFLAMIFGFAYRNQPIIKRSQYQLLLSLLLGGILVCGAVWSYAGKPTSTICKTRSSSLTYGFTLIFGSLLVKTLRVYRAFLSGAMKRIRLSTSTMFKILGVFFVIDCVIIVVWNAVDLTLPKAVLEKTPQLGGGTVERLRCTSTSFIFTAILLFWKAVVLFAGLYLSFLIRKVSSDFQESVWIFASSLVVLCTSVVLLSMAYLVELPAETFYLFFSFLLLAPTAIVVVLMIVPKIL
uniref:G-protein coupled receptors family 3 profile domain-containing protein n=1 Tax=Globisporangium ultimum (strain ATCC 200006 / CBS 805.95 / DAOM BR144) TaxID=431595 RepID=K3WZR6_GLOUD